MAYLTTLGILFVYEILFPDFSLVEPASVFAFRMYVIREHFVDSADPGEVRINIVSIYGASESIVSYPSR